MKNWSFAIDNDKLIELVLNGKKKATTSLYDESDLPIIGEDSIIHFDNEKDACIVKTIDYKIMKFKDMTEELVKLEGDLSLSYWKNVHYGLFKSIDTSFNDDTLIVFEQFELVKNLCLERLELGRKIANLNLDLFKEIKSIVEINAGFNNSLFNVNNEYVIKVCTKVKLEDSFLKEYNFYLENKNNKYIPKLYKYDDTKKDIPYVYEIIEKLDGNTLYYYWYKMDEQERENIIKKIIDIIKIFHSNGGQEYDWLNKIKMEVKENLIKTKDLFNEDDYNMILNSLDKYDLYFKDNKFSFIHNDLHFDNIIYNNGDIKIIDFNDAIIAPIDFEFRQIYMCQMCPWKWADSNMDPLQKPNDYKNIWKYVKKYYQELNDIPYLEERMKIYIIWDSARNLPKYKLKEQIDNIVNNSKLL